MFRRPLLIASTVALMLGLTACSGPILKSSTTLPPSAFSPDEFDPVYKAATNIRDIVAVYGQPTRLMNDHVCHPDQKGYVWEYISSRPSFYSNPAERPNQTPTMKKEIHVWRNAQGQMTGYEIVGTFYVQEKHKWLPLMIRHVRPLTESEVKGSRVPVGPGERVADVHAWYQSRGE